MIIYKDIITGDEILSDTIPIKDVGNGLWEQDTHMYKKGAENFQLEGANPSAEGEDADEGGDSGGASESVPYICDQFRLVKAEGLSKKAYQGDLKKYMKSIVDKKKEKGASEDEIKKFQTEAQAAAKKILGNWDNYDAYMGESTDASGMYILVDFREDGVTPYVTVWKEGLEEYKV